MSEKEGERKRGRERERESLDKKKPWSLCLIRLQTRAWTGVRGARAGRTAKAPSPHTFHTSHRGKGHAAPTVPKYRMAPPIVLVFILLLGHFEKRENKLILHNYLC